MNEKRFHLDMELVPPSIVDLSDGTHYPIEDEGIFEDVVKLLNEQQDTIFKLQDLCGKSDGKNAKLRIENKKLQEEIKLLKPTNIEQFEQIQKLQKELNDCEKFRYTVFKRLNEEYKKECSIR